MTKRRSSALENMPSAIAPQLAEIDHDDGEDGAELDQHREAVPETALAEIEKSFRQQQMSGRGHREEFRDALDDAENHRPQCIRHHDLVRYDRYRPEKAGFFSLIRPAAAIAKTRKTPVASLARLGSLARGCGMRPRLALRRRGFLSAAKSSRAACSRCSIIRSVRIRASSAWRSANTASMCGWWRSGPGSGARRFWRSIRPAPRRC